MIYDKVIINNIDDSKIYEKLIKLLRDKYIKVITDDINDTERSTLYIKIKNEKIYVEEKIINIDELFKKYNFAVSLFDKNGNFIIDYAKIISKRKKLSNRLISKYKYCNNFNKLIGALYLSDEEYYLLNESKLKKFIFSKKNNSYTYIIPDENGYLLRGANTYYYLLSNKGKFEHVKYANFREFYYNYQEYFKGIFDNLSKFDNNVLVLSILDNIRNYMLCITNMYAIMKQSLDETILLEFDDKELLDIFFKTYNQMVNILENNNYNYEEIRKILNTVININFLIDIKNTKKILYDKMLKSHRECDNFLENYVCIKYFYDKNSKDENYLAALYGAIEFPLIFNYLSNKKSKVLYISLYGIYKERHKKILNYNDKVFKMRKIVSHKFETCVLCDDNLMTGKTLQYIIDCLALVKIQVNKIFLVNYVSLNRVYQMLDNNTLIDLNLIDKYIYGLFYPTKYSKIKKNTNFNDTYLDEFSMFDLSKEYICYYLYKNGIYTANSRINKYKIEGVL